MKLQVKLIKIILIFLLINVFSYHYTLITLTTIGYILYKDNSKIEGVKAMKGDPKWGIITFQNKNELHTALEAAKESFIIMKRITNS